MTWVHGVKTVPAGRAVELTGVPDGGLKIRVSGPGTVYLGGPDVSADGATSSIGLTADSADFDIPPPLPAISGLLGAAADPRMLYATAVLPGGEDSSFTGDSGTVTAHGGTGGDEQDSERTVEVRWFGFQR